MPDSAVYAPRTNKTGPRLTAAAQTAIVAAVAAGQPQAVVAQQFGVHRNTVSNLCQAVRHLNHPSNPLSGDYKASLKIKAVSAINRGLDSRRDPYRAADIGVKVMTGLGEFSSGNTLQMDSNLAITIEWGQASPTIDVTPAIIDESAT